jgi:hypothetical protein
MHIHTKRVRSSLVLLLAVFLLTPLIGLAQAAQQTPALPPVKQAQLDRETQQIAAARAAPQPPKNLPKPARIQRQPLPQRAPSSESPVPHHTAGNGTIVDSGQAPFPAALFTFENRWFERTAAGDLVVYAGAAHDDPTQGLLAVRLISATPGPTTVYRAPLHSGSLHIVGASGQKLSLVTSSGSQLVFDVAARSFGP